jgi:3-deoxy-manno-octulosonate cytidylyltransferase (CMP-KDO synthetase)
MDVAAVIPARMQAVRLPGKPLLLIAGVPMIIRVLDRVRACDRLKRIIVATDNEEVCRTVEAHGAEARMTSPDHRTGSDRVAEVAATLTEDFVLNIQGDEPLLPPSTVNALIDFARDCTDLAVATVSVPLIEEGEIANPNIVKVVTDKDGKALYFSRYPIPYCRRQPIDLTASASRPMLENYRKHVGIYLYQRQFLLRYVRMAPTPLEQAESLEQLRILENGCSMHVVEVAEDSVSVDTPEDLKIVESIIGTQQRAGKLN